MKTYLAPKFLIQRDPERCIRCQVCVNQCTFDTHYYDTEDDEAGNKDQEEQTYPQNKPKGKVYILLKN